MSAVADFQVYPAIDVRGGQVVRLAQGDYARETQYANDPLALAKTYAEAGATWLHLVDLNAARTGGYVLHALLSAIKAGTGLCVQTGGGVRRHSDIERLLAAGADRVVVGSLAVDAPTRVAAWLDKYGSECLTIALDVRYDIGGHWIPAACGWTRTGPLALDALVQFYAAAGLRHLLCTDIARDGMLAGPNLPLYAQLREWAPALALQASGGTRALADVHAARVAGCAGIVLGRTLLEGHLCLAEALAC